MRLGIFAKTFPGTNAGDVLHAVKRAGFGCAQFNMACVGLPAMPDAVPDDVLDRIGAAAAGAGVALVALSGTYNMIHPDRVVRDAGMRRLGVLISTLR